MIIHEELDGGAHHPLIKNLNPKSVSPRPIIVRKSLGIRSPITVASGKSDVKQLRQEKNQVGGREYHLPDVEELVNRHYKREDFAPHFEGKDNVFLPMPSTSGRNIIPHVFANRLQKDFGGLVIPHSAYATHTTEAKHRTGIQKFQEGSGYDMLEDLSKHRGKNIYSVDDVFTTGESVRAYRNAVQSQSGIVPHVAVLGSADKTFVRDSDLRRLSQKLSLAEHAKSSGHSPETIFPIIKQKLSGLGRHASNQIERSIFGTTPGARRNLENASTTLLS
jgi:hypothetical protein